MKDKVFEIHKLILMVVVLLLIFSIGIKMILS